VRILVVEDETRLAASLHAALETEGYQVDVAPDGAQGLWMAQEYPHDVILLDLMLSELSGLDVCSRLRSAGNWTPILVLTARDGVEDEVGALTTGADDYLAKPFSMAVLLARLRLLARRGAAERPAVITVGDVGLDPASKRVTRAGHEVAVTAREYLMLEFLMRNRDLALSKQQILDYVWDYDFSGDSNIVEVYVRRLRAKLDDGRAGTSIIQTLRGIGYRMSSDEG